MSAYTFILILLAFEGSDSSAKKGVGFSPFYYRCEDFTAFDNISWWYDWRLHPLYDDASPCGNLTSVNRKLVPMVWGWFPKNLARFNMPSYSQALLGFNEPNHVHESNMRPEMAAQHWPEVEKHAHGKPLVSPAAAACGVDCLGTTNEWFDAFFKACNNCRVDYLATHVYSCSASHVMSVLHGLYLRYGRPIWLTEFACSHTHDPYRQLQFMKEVLPLLEAANYVHRYAWYVSRYLGGTFITESANLLHANSSHLTQLGKFYNSFGAGNQVPIVG